eukprot:gene584-2002_t
MFGIQIKDLQRQVATLNAEKGGVTRLRDEAKQQIHHLEQQIQQIQVARVKADKDRALAEGRAREIAAAEKARLIAAAEEQRKEAQVHKALADGWSRDITVDGGVGGMWVDEEDGDGGGARLISVAEEQRKEAQVHKVLADGWSRDINELKGSLKTEQDKAEHFRRQADFELKGSLKTEQDKAEHFRRQGDFELKGSLKTEQDKAEQFRRQAEELKGSLKNEQDKAEHFRLQAEVVAKQGDQSKFATFKNQTVNEQAIHNLKQQLSVREAEVKRIRAEAMSTERTLQKLGVREAKVKRIRAEAMSTGRTLQNVGCAASSVPCAAACAASSVLCGATCAASTVFLETGSREVSEAKVKYIHTEAMFIERTLKKQVESLQRECNESAAEVQRFRRGDMPAPRGIPSLHDDLTNLKRIVAQRGDMTANASSLVRLPSTSRVLGPPPAGYSPPGYPPPGYPSPPASGGMTLPPGIKGAPLA